MNRREAGLADKVPVKKGISPSLAIMPGRANPFGSKLSGRRLLRLLAHRLNAKRNGKSCKAEENHAKVKLLESGHLIDSNSD